MDRTLERNKKASPSRAHRTHCDVYSLGISIQNGANLLGLQHQTLESIEDTALKRFQPDTRPRLDLLYTSDLWNLLNLCQNEDARYRPKLHYLYKETKLRTEPFRALGQAEEAEAFGKGIPGCFHSNVLFKRTDRKRFETDPVFRSKYRKANLRPVWKVLGHPPSQNVAQDEPSKLLGEDQFVHVKFADAAHANVQAGQQRGGLPGNVERKVGKKGKERKKRAGSAQQGIRGLLSKIDFFS